MESLQQEVLYISLVVTDGGQVVESDHVLRPESDALLVAQSGRVLVLLVPEEVGVVVPHLGVVRSAGQARPEQVPPGGPDCVSGEQPGGAEQEEGDAGEVETDGEREVGPGPGYQSVRPPGHQDTPAQAGRVESSLSCHKSHSLENIAGGEEWE